MANYNKSSRRDVLKTVGTVAAGGFYVGTVAGKGDQTSTVYERAQQILQTKGVDAYENYLDRKSIPRSVSKAGLGRSGTGSGPGLSRDTLTCVEPDDDCDLEVKVTLELSKWPYVGYMVHGFVKYKYEKLSFSLGQEGPSKDGGMYVNGWYPAPDGITDGLGMGWDPSSWDLQTPDRPIDSVVHPDYGDYDGGSYNANNRAGVLFEIEPRKTAGADAESADSGTNWALAASSAAVEKQSGYESGDEITALLEHTWGESSTDIGFSLGVSLTGPSVGVTVNPETSVNSEDVGNEPDGDRLKVEAPD